MRMVPRMRALLLACCLALAAPALAPKALAQKPPPLGVPWNGRTVSVPPGKPPPILAAPEPGGVRRVVPSLSEPERPEASGTGFVVADGKILTNRHVVAECTQIVARNSFGIRLQARLVAADATRDLALLDSTSGIGPPLTFRDGPPVRRGEDVITYGFPLSGLLSSGPSLTTGNINALAGIRDNPANFQISAAVQPGNSGGPLFDSRGNVIGVVVSKLNAARVAQLTGGDIPQNVNFAVKGTEALAFLRQSGVQPRTAPSTGPEKRPDAIDSIANPSTVYLQCYR